MSRVEKIGKKTRTFFVPNEIMLDELIENLGRDLDEDLVNLPIFCSSSPLYNGQACCSVSYNIYKDGDEEFALPTEIVFYRQTQKM